MYRNKQRGFTLLELLISVGIVGLLAAIVLPQFTSFRARADRASVLSDCRSIYHGFTLYFLEWDEYPLTADEAAIPTDAFNLTNLKPLTVPSELGGHTLGVDVTKFMSSMAGGQAEKYDSPDPNDQTFYLVLAWARDPSIKFVIAQSDFVSYADGTPVDNNLWLDGAFITQNGKIISQ